MSSTETSPSTCARGTCPRIRIRRPPFEEAPSSHRWCRVLAAIGGGRRRSPRRGALRPSLLAYRALRRTIRKHPPAPQSHRAAVRRADLILEARLRAELPEV